MKKPDYATQRLTVELHELRAELVRMEIEESEVASQIMTEGRIKSVESALAKLA